MLPEYSTPFLSGEKFTVTYQVTGDEKEAHTRALEICYEQTVEFPADLTPKSINDAIVGQIVEFRPLTAFSHSVTISYPRECAGEELVQLLNIIFGNTSIKPGVRVERIDLPPKMLANYRGPRFGRQGLRNLLQVTERPLLCTALKPMGYPTEALAALAYQFALGGIDIIKDDHGLANQSFAPFKERVEACAEAVRSANEKTGYHSIYMPNISAPYDQLLEHAFTAKKLGAGGLMVAPGLIGFDAMRSLADNDDLALPAMSHPALLGSFTASPQNGISHFALYGQINRLAGADITVFPSWGGRFSFSREECSAIVHGSNESMGKIASIFPAPGGGMTMERIPEMLEVYGREVIFLIGGGLHRHSNDTAENSRYFRNLVEKM